MPHIGIMCGIIAINRLYYVKHNTYVWHNNKKNPRLAHKPSKGFI